MARKITPFIPAIIFTLLALIVLGPMLGNGYILTLDMAFTPVLRMPEEVSSSYLFHSFLHFLNLFIPSHIIQKIMLFTILFLSGMGMYHLMRHIQKAQAEQGSYARWGAYLAGGLYMINPFTYSRFMAGQYAVLLGYALLPFVLRALLRFFAAPSLQKAWVIAAWITVVGVVSVHTLGLVTLMALVLLAVFGWQARRQLQTLKKMIGYLLVAAMVFTIASGYWLVPLLTGSSNQGTAVQQFTAADQAAFATAGDGAPAKLSNMLQLQGFWAESYELFRLPQQILPIWPLAVLGFWALIIVGAVWLWKHQRLIAVVLLVSSALALLIALIGTGSWLPGLAGFREPHKFIGIVALAFALFAGCGAVTALKWAYKKWSETGSAVMLMCAVLLPVLLTPTMFWGFNNQLTPHHYPVDWSEMNARLHDDSAVKKVLFLPWHLYMHFPFADRVIVNPADKFFDKPTIISNELEFMNASPTFPDAAKTIITWHILPQAATKADLGQRLHELGFTHILLAKAFDFETYGYLETQPELQLITETPTLKLYRITAQ